MVELDMVPGEIWKALEEKGIPQSSVLLTARADKNADGVFLDNWIFATDTDLILLGGIRTGTPAGSGRKPAQSDRGAKKLRLMRGMTFRFTQLSFETFPLKELSGFSVEELISDCRLTAKQTEVRDGVEETKTILLTYLTGACKESVGEFCKYVGMFREKGEITVDEEAEKKRKEKFCPHCGARYADPERKICPKCMDKGKIIRRMGVFFQKYRWQMAAVLLTLILTSALSVLTPYVSAGFYYDEVLDPQGRFYGQLLLVLGIVIATKILSTGVNMLNGMITSSVSAKVVYDLKTVIFSSIERLSLSFFTGRQTGGLMQQVDGDANTIYWFFCDGFTYFCINVVQVIVVFIIMMTMNPILTLLSLVMVPAVVLMIKWLFRKMQKYHARRFARSRALNALLSDVLSGVRVVKAFSKEKEETRRFDKNSRALADASLKTSNFASTAFPFASFMLYIGNIVIWGVGGWMVITGYRGMQYGELMTFVAYMNMIYSPMFFFVSMMNQMTDCLNAMQRMIEVMDAQPDVVEAAEPVHLPSLSGRVEFSHVSFSYVKNRKVIDDVSFTVEPGEILGVVGHTGAGKSTLVNLLIRLYDVGEGEILIDGINIKKLAFADLRRNIAIVSQETYLFAGTILENIAYAKPDATKDEILYASKMAGAHDFIVKLPDAYSTRIGFGYKDLSGGERQRISIARALLRDPKILILDEATAAMDTETERKIQLALEQLTRGRTTIMIAHRLSTLRDADKLIVIENGKMPESGTHRELLQKKGIYFNLYKLQAEALKNIGIEA